MRYPQSGYRAVGNRCAVDLDQLGVSDAEALATLASLGFKVVDVDPVVEARSLVGKAVYKRRVRDHEAPRFVDCSLLTKWAYGRCGIELLRKPIQQSWAGVEVRTCETRPGDLAFFRGLRNRFVSHPDDGIGHVAIVSEAGTLIQATSRNGVCEVPIASMIDGPKLRSVRRVFSSERVITFEVPEGADISCENDIWWLVRPGSKG